MSTITQKLDHVREKSNERAKVAIEFAKQAERLGQYFPPEEDDTTGSTQAVKATFITAQDPVIQTADGRRLPAVPVEEAIKLNELRDILADHDPSQGPPLKSESRESRDGTIHGASHTRKRNSTADENTDGPLRDSTPPSRTNPLFPPLPLYGPPSLIKRVHFFLLRVSSAILSLCFLLVIILGAAFTSIPLAISHIWLRLTFRNPDKRRPFYQEEERRKKARKAAERAWASQKKGTRTPNGAEKGKCDDEYVPLEGGPDHIPCDVRYYARRVGLECEIFEVQTEDGFIIDLWHLYNPRDYQRKTDSHLSPHSPDIFTDRPSTARTTSTNGSHYPPGEKKYPVLMMHGLLQSAGAYCTNDDDSLAFFLAKSGYDVWLGNNRCGFNPKHTMLKYSDPRMWAWNIRQMGILDLPALISRVLSETGFPKLGLICHSQGTTQTFVALAKEQRPEIADKISVFCALAPAAYAGPLVGKMYFKFMRVISPGMFRVFFGIHAFIPIMMTMHSLLPPKFYGAMGYRVFSFMFNWTDDRWERALRNRMFQFAPVYVSAESMRWWLGRECFAKQKCILATREEKIIEDKEDEQEDQLMNRADANESSSSEEEAYDPLSKEDKRKVERKGANRDDNRAKYAWYGPGTPPFAMWVAGADELVDGRRLLRRFERNREPHVDVVHAKIIEGYEHLDVIWAMDSIEKVGKEVREVIWKTASEDARKMCRVPKGCEEMTEFYKRREERENATREIDVTAGEWSKKGAEQVSGGGGEGRQ